MSKFDKREEKPTREAPACRIIPLSQFACDTSQNAPAISRLYALPHKAVPLIEFDCSSLLPEEWGLLPYPLPFGQMMLLHQIGLAELDSMMKGFSKMKVAFLNV